jgi:DNA polymerase
MFVGEGPGRNEDEQGRPFVGESGQMLRDMVDEVMFSIPFFTNIVKCRPPNNRDPHQSEIDACLHYLDEQIQVIDPKVIVPVGRYAMAQFLPDDSIMKVHGQPKIVHGRIILPILHTAFALRRREMKPLIEADLRLVPRLLDTPIPQDSGAKLTILL